MTPPSIDLERLLKLRLAVARFGEMDLSGWWNTKGQLGRLGAAILKRGFPRTYRFAQARAVIKEGGRLSAVDTQPYFGSGLETLEQLNAALKGLREECERPIGEGRKVILS